MFCRYSGAFAGHRANIPGVMNLILKAIAAFFSCLPLGVALAMGRGLGWIYGSVIRYHRQDAMGALTRSFPGKTPCEIRGIVRRMYANLGMNLVEVLRLGQMTDEFLRANIDIEGEGFAREALARNKGVVILTGHVGNWDLLCTVVPRLGYPLTVISKDIKSERLNEFWMNLRQRFGVKFVPAHNSYRACLTALKKNELIGFILDQNMIRTEGIFVDFFGRPACTTPGMAYMSAQSGAPVVPVFMLRRENGRHLVKVLPLIDPPPNREPEVIREFTQRYTKIIEETIRQCPDQWIWIHRRWRTAPPPSGFEEE
jgi:Kdo2-lipid IVA lauroyltransferase/acyltransferase